MVWTRRKFIKTGVLTGLGLVIADSVWFEKYVVETNHYRMREANEKGHALRLIQVSDLHLHHLNTTHRQIAKKINALAPHLLLITGDSIDTSNSIKALGEFMGLIDPTIKKFAIPGNWEYWGNVDMQTLGSMYALHNCELLINSSRRVQIGNSTLVVTGVDDYLAGQANIEKALSNYVPGDYHIVLNQCPAYSDTIADYLNGKIQYNLILSGHTHGGQINLFGFVPFTPPGCGAYLKGWYNNQTLYVNKGIGTSLLPLRFMARAEIAVFDF